MSAKTTPDRSNREDSQPQLPTNWTVKVLILSILSILSMVVLVGCAKPSTVGLDSPVPSARIKATAVAAEEGDETAIPDLIRMLDSDDPLVRMMSQHALDRLTGETFGYSYADPESKRNEAIQRWASWYEAPDAISP